MMTAVLKHLKAKVLDGEVIAITLEMTHPSWMTGNLVFLGASMPASASPGANCSSFTLHPKKNEDGIFAVQIEENHKVSDKKVSFVTMHRDVYFLAVTWKDGKPFAHIDTPHFPTKGIGHLHGAGGGTPSIEVTLPNGTRVCSDVERKVPFVGANLLCQYLAGTAKLHEVLHSAVQHRLEPARQSIIDKMQRDWREREKQIAFTLEARDGKIDYWQQVAKEHAQRFQLVSIALSDMYDDAKTKLDSFGEWLNQSKRVLNSGFMRHFLGRVGVSPLPEARGLVEPSKYYLHKQTRAALRESLGLPTENAT